MLVNYLNETRDIFAFVRNVRIAYKPLVSLDFEHDAPSLDNSFVGQFDVRSRWRACLKRAYLYSCFLRDTCTWKSDGLFFFFSNPVWMLRTWRILSCMTTATELTPELLFSTCHTILSSCFVSAWCLSVDVSAPLGILAPNFVRFLWVGWGGRPQDSHILLFIILTFCPLPRNCGSTVVHWW